MQSKTMFLSAATLVAAMTLINVSATAQTLPCSWPAETTGSGITNFEYPDTNATLLDYAPRFDPLEVDRNQWHISPSPLLLFHPIRRSRNRRKQPGS